LKIFESKITHLYAIEQTSLSYQGNENFSPQKII